MTPNQARLPIWSRALSAVLGIALAYLIAYWLSKWVAPKPLSAPAASVAPALELSGNASKQAAEALGLLFSKPAEQAINIAPPDIKLHGIVFAGAHSSIVANAAGEKSQVYRVGERIGAYRIRSIQKDTVILEPSPELSKGAVGQTLRVELPKRESLLR
jgi:type II secretory pathway component PulC